MKARLQAPAPGIQGAGPIVTETEGAAFNRQSVLSAALAMLSGLLLVLAFPPFNYAFLAWLGLVPLFWALEGKSRREAFLSGFLTGVVFFGGTIYWLIHVTLPGMVGIVLYLALFFGAFGLLTSLLASLPVLSLFMALPAAWVVIEWVRSHALTGFGWALIAHSQSATLQAIQIADLTGAYGVSFLVVMVNFCLYTVIRHGPTRKDIYAGVVITTVALFLVFGYGKVRLNNIFTGETIRVAVTQGNIPQDKKWDARFREETVRTYERLTRLAAAGKPDLIVWPETAIPCFLESEPDLLVRTRKLAAAVGTPLLVGTVREEPGREPYYNNALLFSAGGEIIGSYDKVHLVPFGEYIPFEQFFGVIEYLAPSPIGDCTPGAGYTLLTIPRERTSRTGAETVTIRQRLRFGTLICFEGIFPGIAREMVGKGALFLVNITNDAWFKKTAAPYQHAQNSVFRAIENRTPVVRAANTGFSCFIDQKGHITGWVERAGESICVEGFAVGEITLSRVRTFYTLYGDIFAYLCIFFTVIALFLSRRFPRRT